MPVRLLFLFRKPELMKAVLLTIRVKGKEADASNIIAVMALDVVCGQRVEVEICGTDEGVAYRGMKKFFEENL